MNLSNLHQALLLPETYPAARGPIEYRETHISRLYFTSDQVFKFKKPVDFGFLDFSTLDRRRFFCDEEVRLNRRFCPDTYLGVVPLRRLGDTVRLGGRGEILDFAVQMRRLPEDRMLDQLIRVDEPGLDKEMDRLARRIAELHRESDIHRSADGEASLDDIRANWDENFRQTLPFVGRTLTEGSLENCRTYVEGYLQSQAGLLRRRDVDGWIRDGHGDLHAEHVCLTDPIRIYDCIEFNRRFRVGDVAADLAFLLMDLDYRDRRDLGRRLLVSYRQAMNTSGDLALLLPFYQIYRAYVRGKVESFLSVAEGVGPDEKAEAAGRARRYFGLALGYQCPTALVLTCGLTGVGKSHLARHLATALGAVWLRSDLLRRELHGLGPTEPSEAAFGEGIYTPLADRRTYERMRQLALSSLEAGRTVIADASFARRSDRDRFRRAAEALGVPCFLLHLECDPEIALDRLARRRRIGGDPSEGRPEIYFRQAHSFERPGGHEKVIEVDSEEEVDYNALHVLTAMAEPAGMPT